MRELSMSAAIRETLARLLREDPKVFLIGEDIGVYGGAFKVTQGFAEEFGDNRVIDTPIAECGFIGVACGAALLGSRPIAEIMFMDFLALALDPLLNAAVKWKHIYGEDYRMPLIVRCPAGAGRSYGPTHSQSFEGLLLNVPNLTICCPSDAADAAGMLLGAYAAGEPTVFIEHKALYARKCPVPDLPQPIPPGLARILRAGEHLTMLCYGRQTLPTLAAADELARRGILAEVIDLRSIKPLDRETILESVRRTGRALSVEESPVIGGVGGELAAIILEGAFEYLEAPFRRLGAAENPIPCCPDRENACFPSARDIVETAIRLYEF